MYAKISMVPEDEAVYTNLTALEFVELNASLAGVPNAQATAGALLEQVGLAGDRDRRLGEYSKGMRQRAKVAAALVSDPEVIVLDEPLNGADPVQRAALIDVFVELGKSGKTVITSSHVLAEVERMAEQLVAMVDGRLAAEGTVDTLRAAMTDRPRLVAVDTDRPRPLAAQLMAQEGVQSIEVTETGLMISSADAVGLAMELPRSLKLQQPG